MSLPPEVQESSLRPVSPCPEFGLLAWLEGTRIRLPLKGIECRFETAADLAHVEVDQIYHQTADRALECTYVFPLPANAAVHRCEFHINGRIIRARIEEAHQARREYEAARNAGRRAALVESNRPNLFTLSLANVQPQDVIVVRLGYVQPLEILGEERRLRIPTCPGIRYIPGRPLNRSNLGPGIADDTDQVPDASRISPPRISALDPDAAFFTVRGRIHVPAEDFDRITSQSHAVQVVEESLGRQVSLRTESAVPDQDFLLGWTLRTAGALKPRAWTSRHGGHQYALLELRAPANLPGRQRRPMDVYFLLDRSGSMSGSKWSQACVAVHELLKQLSPDDRIQLTCFDDQESPLTRRPVPIQDFLSRWPLPRLTSLPPGGGTELLPALLGTLKRVTRDSRERQPVLLLLTDGQIGNEQAVTEALGGHPGLVVHTFGVDTVVNDALLQGIARRQRGRCVLLRPDEDVPGALGRLGVLLANPVVTGIELPPAWETADGPLPDLYEGQTASGLVRGPEDGKLELRGLGPDGTAFVLPSVNLDPVAGPAVPLLWARRRLLDLEQQNQSASCVSLSKEFNLLCRFTAFIAWDEHEPVAVAQQHLQQPALAPAGWNGVDPADVHYSSFFEAIEPRAGRSFASGKPSSAMRLAREEDWNSAADWSLEPLFQLPGGDTLRQLLRRWIAAENSGGNPGSEERLFLLVHTTVGEHPHAPMRQLLALIQRLPALFGAGSQWTSELESLRRREGW